MKSTVRRNLRARLATLRLKGTFAMTALAAVAAFSLGVPQVANAQPLTPAQLKAQGKQRLIVAYKAGAKSAASSAISAAGGRVVVDLNDDSAFAVELPSGSLATLKRSSSIDFIENDPLRYAFGATAVTPTRPGIGARASKTLDSTQVVPYGITMVQADQVPDTNASNRKLCIVDSGIDRDHEDLSGIPVDGTNLSGSGEWYTDEASHGTHVAGTIAAINNTLGVVGVLPNKRISIYIAKVFDATGSASSSVIDQGVRACINAKANVISMSLGGTTSNRLEQKLYDIAAKRGILVIAAAGNAGTSDISYPAGYDAVVSVAAVDSNMLVAPFSQFNADVELAGPGVNVLSTVPLGSQTSASVTVGSSPYSVDPMTGSPRVAATGPLADFGIGDTPVAGSMTGKVCLIQRGTIAFADKVLNCQTSGGVGAIIYNNTSGELLGTLGTTVVTIPAVGALQADGATMLTQLGQSTSVSVFGNSDQYAYYSGTSMATPHVSAVTALVWSYFPKCTAAQMRTSLDNSALDLGDAGRDVYYGYGLVQAKTAFDHINASGCGG